MTKPVPPDKFAPLTSQERAAVDATSGGKKDDGECLMPVPADAPPMPTAHPKWGGVASGRWPYLDASGAPLFEVWRFDPPGDRKQFYPLSLWRASSGRMEWRWKGVPTPRPLYGLDRLAARPGASVVVCDGEKSADAAAKVFPESVCVTSPGGAEAASNADWTPLVNRKLLIWPDFDERGERYARQVAAITAGLRCELSMVDAAALAAIAPEGSKAGRPKADAADCVADWPDMAALRKAVHGLAKPFEGGPQFVSWGVFIHGRRRAHARGNERPGR